VHYFMEAQMTKKNILAGLIILVIGSLLLSACSTPEATTVVPTVDANLIYTQAAQTVAASVAQTDAARPQPTATQEPQPTNTMDPNMAAAMTATANAVLNVGAPTATLAAGQPTATLQATLAPLPTATSAAVVSTPKPTGDKAELVGQDPDDGTSVGQKDIVTVRLKFQNTGTTTWNRNYRLVYFAGEKMGLNDMNIREEVPPGSTTELIFQLTAPSSSGSKKVIWVLQNPDGVNFYSLWLELNVR
jgi:hypothetical protein